MWTLSTEFVTVFCLSAVATFGISLLLMLLAIHLRRAKPTPQPMLSQGQPCDIIYAPTTEHNTAEVARPLICSTVTDQRQQKAADVAKPLLIGFEKVQENVYPSRELEHLTTNEEQRH